MHPYPHSVSLDALSALKDDILSGSSPADDESRHALWEVAGVVLDKLDHSAFLAADIPAQLVMVEEKIGGRGIIGSGKLLKLVPYIIEIVKLFK